MFLNRRHSRLLIQLPTNMVYRTIINIKRGKVQLIPKEHDLKQIKV